jgi:hypothetical protein
MDFKIAEVVHHPLERVYRTNRDHLADLVPYMPNVDSIEVLEQHETQGGIRHVYRWKVSGAVPRTVRPFFSDKAMTYLDRNEWFDAATRVDWRFEIGVFPEAVSCHGSNYFTPGNAPGTTEIALTGHLGIDLAKVRGVPRFLHGLASSVESFVLGQVRPNLVAVAVALGKFLDAHPEI